MKRITILLVVVVTVAATYIGIRHYQGPEGPVELLPPGEGVDSALYSQAEWIINLARSGEQALSGETEQPESDSE